MQTEVSDLPELLPAPEMHTVSKWQNGRLLLTCNTAGVRMGDNSMTPKRLPTWIFAIGHLGALGHRIFEITMLSLCAGILKGAARQLPIASALASSSFQQIRNASHAENTNVFLKEVRAYPSLPQHFVFILLFMLTGTARPDTAGTASTGVPGEAPEAAPDAPTRDVRGARYDGEYNFRFLSRWDAALVM